MGTEAYPLLMQLAADHELEDRVVGAMFGWQQALGAHSTDRTPLTQVLEAFRDWSQRHHDREEVLFVTLVERAEVPSDRGPVMVLREEHQRLDAAIRSVQMVAANDATADSAVADALVEHCRDRWEHLDKENGVLLPEAGQRLRREGVRDLEVPSGLVDELDRPLIVRLEQFVDQFPPADDPELVRGEGCVVCREFANRCSGIEHEWWTTWEWAEIRARMQG